MAPGWIGASYNKWVGGSFYDNKNPLTTPKAPVIVNGPVSCLAVKRVVLIVSLLTPLPSGMTD